MFDGYIIDVQINKFMELLWILLITQHHHLDCKGEPKHYIFKTFPEIKLPRPQHIATFIIQYGPHIDTIFAPQDFGRKLRKQLVNIINEKPPADVDMKG